MATEGQRRLCVPPLILETLKKLSLKKEEVDRKQRPVLTFCAPDRPLFDPQCLGMTREKMESEARRLGYVPADLVDLRSMLEGAYRMMHLLEAHKDLQGKKERRHRNRKSDTEVQN